MTTTEDSVIEFGHASARAVVKPAAASAIYWCDWCSCCCSRVCCWIQQLWCAGQYAMKRHINIQPVKRTTWHPELYWILFIDGWYGQAVVADRMGEFGGLSNFELRYKNRAGQNSPELVSIFLALVNYFRWLSVFHFILGVIPHCNMMSNYSSFSFRKSSFWSIKYFLFKYKIQEIASYDVIL